MSAPGRPQALIPESIARRVVPVSAPARCCLGLAVMLTLAVLAGCDTLLVGQVEPALFPAAVAASAPPLAGRAAVELPPTVRDQTLSGLALCAAGRTKLQLPLGAIVDAALQRQLGPLFTGGAGPAALPLTGTRDFTVALTVNEMRLDMDHKLNWVVPIPAPPPMFVMPLASSTNYSARLELDLRLTDSLGRQLMQTTVDSGPVVVERGQWTSETPDQRCLKLTHQAAWQAAGQAARRVHEAVQADRQRERAL